MINLLQCVNLHLALHFKGLLLNYHHQLNIGYAAYRRSINTPLDSLPKAQPRINNLYIPPSLYRFYAQLCVNIVEVTVNMYRCVYSNNNNEPIRWDI